MWKLQLYDLEADDSASIQENAEHRANAVIATMAQGNAELGKYDRKKARTAAAVGVLSVAGGYFAGKAINGVLHGKGHVSKVGGPKGSPGPAPAAPAVPSLTGGGVEVSSTLPVAPAEIVSHITPGGGLIDNLTHTEVGLNPAQAARAVERMRAEGLLDGTHIAGVAERAGRIIVYARGAGDGALHFSDPRVLEIIQETKSS